MDSSKEELIEIEKLFMKLNFYRTDDVFKGNIDTYIPFRFNLYL